MLPFISIDLGSSQLLNAKYTIDVTLSGIVIDVIAQPENAVLVIPVTPPCISILLTFF